MEVRLLKMAHKQIDRSTTRGVNSNHVLECASI